MSRAARDAFIVVAYTDGGEVDRVWGPFASGSRASTWADQAGIDDCVVQRLVPPTPIDD